MFSHEDIQQISAVIRDQFLPMTERLGDVADRLVGVSDGSRHARPA